MRPCDLLTNVNRLHQLVYYQNSYSPGIYAKNYSKQLEEETGLGYSSRTKAWDNKY